MQDPEVQQSQRTPLDDMPAGPLPEPPPRASSAHIYMKFIARNGLAVLIELPADAISSRADCLIALRYATQSVIKMPAGAVPLPRRE